MPSPHFSISNEIWKYYDIKSDWHCKILYHAIIYQLVKWNFPQFSEVSIWINQSEREPAEKSGDNQRHIYVCFNFTIDTKVMLTSWHVKEHLMLNLGFFPSLDRDCDREKCILHHTTMCSPSPSISFLFDSFQPNGKFVFLWSSVIASKLRSKLPKVLK